MPGPEDFFGAERWAVAPSTPNAVGGAVVLIVTAGSCGPAAAPGPLHVIGTGADCSRRVTRRPGRTTSTAILPIRFRFPPRTVTTSIA
jgi:hypothetical protein